MKRNIGIFIGSFPGLLQRNQGISRLLLFLLSSKEFRDRVYVAMPSWCLEEFKILLRDIKEIQEDDIPIISVRSKKSFLFLTLLVLGKKIFNILQIINNLKTKIKQNVQISVFFIPLILPLILLYGICKILKSIISKEDKTYSMLRNLNSKIKNKYINLKIKISSKIHSIIKDNEIKKLIKYINQRKDIGIWYIPTGYWPEVKEIKNNKVIAIPDVVFIDFPSIFYSHLYNTNLRDYLSFKEVLRLKAHFLCIGEYVKTQHLMKHFHIDEKNISVIKHGITDYSHYLVKDFKSPTEVAIQILEEYQKENLKNNSYLSDFHLPSMRFLFYSSQIRPHKNVLNLVKAYEILLRKRFINIKLVLTGNPLHNSDVDAYIKEKHLQYDVISFFDISNEVLVALNHLAACAVNPSLFEGGYLWSFCEAYSVGTPSVMSRIPASLEECQDEKLNSIMLFDPYKVEDMVNKIEWAINHRQELLQLQKPLYDKFAARSWDCAAKDYLDLFDKVASQGVS